MTETTISGRIWVLLDEKGHLIENIDTDQIFHNAHLHITDVNKMGEYTLGNLEGWKDFPQKSRPGDILVVGRNFGAGSSRQQAVDCFRSLQIGAILSPSFGAIYFRNAVNSGFPVLRGLQIPQLVDEGKLETGDEICLHFLSGEAQIINKNLSFPIIPMSDVQSEIYRAGGLYNYGKTWTQD
ncbi:MAG: 3-isopropylmalate dehydratase [Candidatus Aminicenantes bacterium]|nr:MAG: 3-isopropylmalate dehydratase [Candidatus Aminicenantes bacterium]